MESVPTATTGRVGAKFQREFGRTQQSNSASDEYSQPWRAIHITTAHRTISQGAETVNKSKSDDGRQQEHRCGDEHVGCEKQS